VKLGREQILDDGALRRRLCQAATGLSISPMTHMVEDFRRSPIPASRRYFIARLPN
jgi:hypothetical protein